MAALCCQPCSETATTQKKILCCWWLCIQFSDAMMFFILRNWKDTKRAYHFSILQSQVLYVKHKMYEAEA